MSTIGQNVAQPMKTWITKYHSLAFKMVLHGVALIVHTELKHTEMHSSCQDRNFRTTFPIPSYCNIFGEKKQKKHTTRLQISIPFP